MEMTAVSNILTYIFCSDKLYYLLLFKGGLFTEVWLAVLLWIQINHTNTLIIINYFHNTVFI